MRVLGIDFETTGLDTGNDAITEIGAVLWDVEKKQPLQILNLFCWDDYVASRMNPETVKMMSDLCGLTPELLQELGKTTATQVLALSELIAAQDQPLYIVAHNGENFDKPILMATLKRLGVAEHLYRAMTLDWIDTKTDIPFLKEPDSRRLKHLALDCGFMNPFEHRAVFDVLTMLRVLSHYDIGEVIEYSKIPFITVRGMVGYDDRQLAKDQRFSWEKIGDQTYPKCWVKRIKANKLEEEQAKCKFQVVQIA